MVLQFCRHKSFSFDFASLSSSFVFLNLLNTDSCNSLQATCKSLFAAIISCFLSLESLISLIRSFETVCSNCLTLFSMFLMHSFSIFYTDLSIWLIFSLRLLTVCSTFLNSLRCMDCLLVMVVQYVTRFSECTFTLSFSLEMSLIL